MVGRLAHLAVCLAVAALIAGQRARAEQPAVLDVGSGGLTLKVLFMMPPAHPRAAVVMFPGGDGRIRLGDGGAIGSAGNFLIRTRDLWLQRGFMFVAIDAVDGLTGSDERIGPAMQGSIARIVGAVRSRTDAPIWLLGTSAGAPSAMAGAASLPAGAIRGVVISSPVSTWGRRASVFDTKLDHVGVPVLIQVHRNDGCNLSPPGNAARIKAALTASPAVDIEEFSGGDPPQSKPCEAFSPHGYLGIEPQVVAAAADWIGAHER
jgi:hypothetical protein